MKLNDFFDNIYCLNLDFRTDRYEECLLEFNKIGITVERFSAIDGKTVSNPNPRVSVGLYGLYLTHINMLKDAIEKKYNNILLLEDDVKFIDNFNEHFNEKIKYLPEDWDLFYLGGNHIFYQGMFTLITGDKSIAPNIDNYRSLNHELCKTTWTQCAHAVGINGKYFNELLNQIIAHPSVPIDILYSMLQKNNNTYTFLPSIVIQRESFSNIENKVVNYSDDIGNSF